MSIGLVDDIVTNVTADDLFLKQNSDPAARHGQKMCYSVCQLTYGVCSAEKMMISIAPPVFVEFMECEETKQILVDEGYELNAICKLSLSDRSIQILLA